MIPEYAILQIGQVFSKIIVLPKETFVITLSCGKEFTTQWYRRTRKEAFAARKHKQATEGSEAACQQPNE